MKLYRNFLIALVAAGFVVACGEMKENKNAKEMGNVETPDNLEVNAPNVYESPEDMRTLSALTQEHEAFDTLDLALEKADLHSTLNENIPYTVFAPTDEAFKKLPDGKLDELLLNGNKPELISVLTYHVVSGEHDSASIEEGIAANNGVYTLETLEGGRITFTLTDGSILLTDVKGNIANIVEANVEASNGYVHGIDQVIMYQ